MANVNLVPVTFNPTIQTGLAQFFTSSAVQTPAGAAVDLSAWNSLSAKLAPQTPNPTGSDVSFGTVTGSNTGILTLELSATDLATAPAGTAKIIIEGVHVALDDPQVLAVGIATLQTA